jgi:oligopeptidase B
VAYAIAHIRGGDEMGEKWREDGMLMKKKNTFFDFIDCAEFLDPAEVDLRRPPGDRRRQRGRPLMGAVVNLRARPVSRRARRRCRSST